MSAECHQNSTPPPIYHPLDVPACDGTFVLVADTNWFTSSRDIDYEHVTRQDPYQIVIRDKHDRMGTIFSNIDAGVLKQRRALVLDNVRASFTHIEIVQIFGKPAVELVKHRYYWGNKVVIKPSKPPH